MELSQGDGPPILVTLDGENEALNHWIENRVPDFETPVAVFIIGMAPHE